MDIRDDFKKGLYYMGRALLGFMATREIFQMARNKYEEYAEDDEYAQGYDYDYNRYKRKRNAWMKILIPAAGMYLVWRMMKSGSKKKKKREEEDDD